MRDTIGYCCRTWVDETRGASATAASDGSCGECEIAAARASHTFLPFRKPSTCGQRWVTLVRTMQGQESRADRESSGFEHGMGEGHARVVGGGAPVA